MPDLWSIVQMALFVCVLAVVNIYVKTASRVPELFELRLRVFLNLAFALYAATCILFALLAFVYFQSKISNGFVLVVLAGLVGVLAGNTEIKFAGQGLQPLVLLIQRLEAMVDTTIARRMGELEIAERARLRDQLTDQIPEAQLERELLLLGDDVTAIELERLRQRAGDRGGVYRGLVAAEIIKRSEPNARRLLKERGSDTQAR
jgi:hypothetical protein